MRNTETSAASNATLCHQYWSMTEGAFNCLIDERRTRAFIRAIRNTVRKGDTVVDLGSGTGVLAMCAARAGAGLVYAVESDPHMIRQLRLVIAANGMEGKVRVIAGDAATVNLPRRVDVIIAEMVSTGLIGELQVQATNNALRFASRRVRVLVSEFRNYVELVQARQRFYGLSCPVVQYQYPATPQVKTISLSRPHLYSEVSLRARVENEWVDSEAILPCTRAGRVNALRISSYTRFSDDSAFGHSFAYCYPIILPIVPFCVKRKMQARVRLKYRLCHGLSGLEWSARIAHQEDFDRG